jgi:hypothetical protein
VASRTSPFTRIRLDKDMSHMVLSAERLSALTDDDLARIRVEPLEQMGKTGGNAGKDGRPGR